MIFCNSCIHKEVCRKREEFESLESQSLEEEKKQECKDFREDIDYKRYGNIYEIFQPIFKWLQMHYPHGEVKFLVDHSSALMLQEHGIAVYDKDLAKRVNQIEEE